MHPANAFEEEQRNGALQPFVEVLLDFLLPVTVGNFDRDPGSAVDSGLFLDPVRLGESLPKKANRQGLREQLDAVSEAEDALEPKTPEPDRVQGFLVRVAETAERRKVFLREILAVVLEYECSILDAHCGFRRTRVIGVLQEFRKNVPGTLDLLEKLMPRTGEFRILLKLFPSRRSSLSD